ncbi:biotin/lipoyl-containing protein, partial [Streptosporangium carneum]
MADIRVPKLNNNDTEYLVVAWLVEDGKPVREGEPVAVLETSKAADELEAEESGYLHHVAALNAWIAPGAVLARITAEPDAPALAPGDTVVAGDVLAPVETVASVGTVVPGETVASGGTDVPVDAPAGDGVPVSSGGPVSGDTAAPGRPVVSGGQGPFPEDSRAADPALPARDPVITDPARALMTELGVTPAQIAALGLAVVRR